MLEVEYQEYISISLLHSFITSSMLRQPIKLNKLRATYQFSKQAQLFAQTLRQILLETNIEGLISRVC